MTQGDNWLGKEMLPRHGGPVRTTCSPGGIQFLPGMRESDLAETPAIMGKTIIKSKHFRLLQLHTEIQCSKHVHPLYQKSKHDESSGG